MNCIKDLYIFFIIMYYNMKSREFTALIVESESNMHKFHALTLHFWWYFIAAISSAFYWRLIDGILQNKTNQGSLFRSIKPRHSFDRTRLSSRINSLFFLFSLAVLFHKDLRAFICRLNRRSWLFSRMWVRIARIYRRNETGYGHVSVEDSYVMCNRWYR